MALRYHLPHILTSGAIAGLLLCSCAPDRDKSSDGSSSAQSLTASLFTVNSADQPNEDSQARLVLVDQNMDCLELNSNGSIRWWDLAAEVEFVELYLRLGPEQVGWSREYQTFYAWQANEPANPADQAYFTGLRGFGNQDNPQPESEPEEGAAPNPTPPAGREISHQIGNDEASSEDLLSVSSYAEDGEVTGSLYSTLGNYHFRAEHCGNLSETPAGELPANEG